MQSIMNEDISPIRAKSKLKKKRNHRQQATTRESEASSSCSLQNNKVLPINNNGSTAGNEADAVVQYNSLQKENNTDCTTVNKKRSLSSVIGTDGSKVGLRQRDPKDQLLLSPRRKTTLVHEDDSTSKLAFIDEMDLSQLSAIQKGIISSDLNNNIDVKLELERAFTASKDDSTVPDNEGKNNNNTDQNTILHHDFIGRIGPPIHHDWGDKNANKSRSIAFPSSRCNDSTSTTTNCQQSIISMVNLTRQTCYGISIPLSWCKFPRSQCEENDSKTKSASSIDEMHLHEAKTTEIPSFCPLLDDTEVDESEANNNEAITKEASSSSSVVQYQGRIRITSVKGATIREVFDIDESDYVIGKLSQGDERYFVEKRLLPAPEPDSSDDDESDEDEEDCVAVVRYKIVLDAHDCSGCSHEFIERDSASGKMVGWISDRGRLAADPYFILKEL